MYPKVSCSPGCPKSSGCMNLPGKYFLIGNYNLGGSSSIPCKTYIIYLLTFFYARLFNVFIISGNNITFYNKKNWVDWIVMILITLYWLIFCEIASLKFGTTQYQFLFRLIKFPASSLVKGLTDFQRKKTRCHADLV